MWCVWEGLVRSVWTACLILWTGQGPAADLPSPSAPWLRGKRTIRRSEREREWSDWRGLEGRGCRRQEEESKHATVSVSVSEKASMLCHGWPDVVSPERERKERKKEGREETGNWKPLCCGVCVLLNWFMFYVFFPPMNDETKEVKVLSWCDENDTKLVCVYYVWL